MYKIYGKDGCSFCIAAKRLLDGEGIDYTYLSLGKDYDRADLLELNPEFATYPQIFKDDELVGGYQELLEDLI